MILGLDISTSCTGYCIFNEDGFLDIGYICLKKHKTLVEKAQEIKSALLQIKNRYHIKSIGIEENLQAFRPGFSSANTLMKLAQFNGTVQWISYEVFNIVPSSINVNTARKTVGLKIKRKDELSTKEQVLKWVTSDCNKINWPYKTISRGRNKGQVVVKNEAYDMADAYIVGKAFHILKKQHTVCK